MRGKRDDGCGLSILFNSSLLIGLLSYPIFFVFGGIRLIGVSCVDLHGSGSVHIRVVWLGVDAVLCQMQVMWIRVRAAPFLLSTVVVLF